MNPGYLRLKIFGARGLKTPKSQKKNSYYLLVQTDNSISRTNVVETISKPKWKSYMSLKIENPLTYVVFKIMCYNPNGEDSFLGRYDLNLWDLFRLTSENSKNFLHLPMTWFSLNPNPFRQTVFRSSSSVSDLLLEIFYQIPDSWFEVYEGYRQFIAGNYNGCILKLTHTLEYLKPKKSFIFYLLRGISYFHEEKYELSIRDSVFMNDQLKKNADGFYRTASMHYLVNDFESAKSSLNQAIEYVSSNQNLGSGQLKLDIQELENKISKSEKKIKESEIDLFLIQCKDMYFNIDVVRNYQSMLVEVMKPKNTGHLFNNENTPEKVIVENFFDIEDKGEFSQNFAELLKKKRIGREHQQMKLENENIKERGTKLNTHIEPKKEKEIEKKNESTNSNNKENENGPKELNEEIIEETTKEWLDFFN
ncbi:extended synaptotagmin-like protein 2 isoform c [Anaeramoeba flamelloides]|uniref:Extended synaptotagmin-like protein 2 isoform c n=1 Tax=Anaeramoeba flamelloides TaxID=1746091 RepID=A0AAV8A4A8_9EUKA|nr:extended synaptotagmin-like protein 2 isoform c [Anaeramoeba flamelloides]